jgi:hypothetical protein
VQIDLGAHVLAQVDDRAEAPVRGSVADEAGVLDVLRPDAEGNLLAHVAAQSGPFGRNLLVDRKLVLAEPDGQGTVGADDLRLDEVHRR